MPYYSLRLSETEFTEDERQKLASEGKAMSDGSYPVRNKSDLRNAIKCVGLGGNTKTSIHRHIIGQARKLGAEDMLPDSWDIEKKESFVSSVKSGVKSGASKVVNALSHPIVGHAFDASLSAERETDEAGHSKGSVLSAASGGVAGGHYGAKGGEIAGSTIGKAIGGETGSKIGKVAGSIVGGGVGQIYGGKIAGSAARKIDSKIRPNKVVESEDDDETESAEEESADYLDHFAKYRQAQKLIASAEESLDTGELTDPEYDEAITLASKAIGLCSEENIVCMAKKIIQKAMHMKDKHGISGIVVVNPGLANPVETKKESSMGNEFINEFEEIVRESFEEKVASPISNKDLAKKVKSHVKNRVAGAIENLGSKTITVGGLAKAGGVGIAAYGAKKAYDAVRGSSPQYRQESYRHPYIRELLEGERDKNLAIEVKNRIVNGSKHSLKNIGSKALSVKNLAKAGGAGVAAYGAKKAYDAVRGSSPQYRQESYKDQEFLEGEKRKKESSYPSHLSKVEFPTEQFAPYAQAYEKVDDSPSSEMWSTFNQYRVHRTTGR